ncbi:MAG: hypothetical protein K2V38_04435, partial [Gemmataceae bacterium]|nr:hypothetical protein [Gemmataceae bacterium]
SIRARAPTGPAVDSPDYANWNRFPVGTTVRRRSVTGGGDSTVTSVDTLTLTAKKDDVLTVSRQNTTDRTGDSYKVANPPVPTNYYRQFSLPQGMTAEDFVKPSRNAKAVGTEDVTVLGKTYKATVYTWSNPTEGGRTDVKAWLSDEFPGRVIRQEMTAPGSQGKMVEEVIELKIP